MTVTFLWWPLQNVWTTPLKNTPFLNEMCGFPVYEKMIGDDAVYLDSTLKDKLVILLNKCKEKQLILKFIT